MLSFGSRLPVKRYTLLKSAPSQSMLLYEKIC